MFPTEEGKNGMKKEVVTPKSPKAVGPYSQAIALGDFIFCAGQIGTRPKDNALVEGGTKEQTMQVLTNLKHILEAAGSLMKNVVKTTVYLKNMDEWALMNDVYTTFFEKPFPARATVEVVRLPKNALVEIEAIAYKTPSKEECACGGNCNC